MAERTPTINFLEALEIDGEIQIFSEVERVIIPANRYYALVEDRSSIMGIVYSERDGFPHAFSEHVIQMKQYCNGSRPAILA